VEAGGEHRRLCLSAVSSRRRVAWVFTGCQMRAHVATLLCSLFAPRVTSLRSLRFARRAPRLRLLAPFFFPAHRPWPLRALRSRHLFLRPLCSTPPSVGVAACPWVSFLLSRRGGLGRVASLHLPHAMWEAAFRRFTRSCAPYLAHARTSRAVPRACSHFSVRLCSVPCAVSGPFRSRLVGSSLVTHAPSVQHFEGGSRGGRW